MCDTAAGGRDEVAYERARVGTGGAFEALDRCSLSTAGTVGDVKVAIRAKNNVAWAIEVLAGEYALEHPGGAVVL